MKGLKTGGRKKGIPNKTTAKTKELLSDFINKKVRELDKLWSHLDPNQKANLIVKLCDFVVPKMKAVELTSDFELLNDAQLNTIIEGINNKIMENNESNEHN